MSGEALDLTGRRALVTGGSSGIGAAICLQLVGAGASVVAVSRSGASPGNGVHSLSVDLTHEADLESIVDEVAAKLGGIDVLVNSAGVADWRPAHEFDRAAFDATMRLNVWAPLRLSQLAHRHLVNSANGVVVMIGSIDAIRPSAGAALYGASKSALSALTVVLAKEWAAEGIRVVQVDPGLVDTPLAKASVESVRKSGVRINLTDRVGDPSEVAGLVHYLVSDLGRFATATSFRIDGGALATGPFDTMPVQTPPVKPRR